jgi:hypothetical protein
VPSFYVFIMLGMSFWLTLLPLLIYANLQPSWYLYSQKEIVEKLWGNVTSSKRTQQLTRLPTVAFYNIFSSTKGKPKEIISEQVRFMDQTGLLSLIDTVYYVSTGSIPVIINHAKFQLLETLRIGNEVYTLGLLYRYCQRSPQSLVLYFHDKGSYHPSTKNEVFRKFLNCYVLTPHCYNLMQMAHNYTTCGLRASPFPHPHYSGNFWWAQCSYINTLMDPWQQLLAFHSHINATSSSSATSNITSSYQQNSITVNNETAAAITNTTTQTTTITPNHHLSACLGDKRFFAEAWILSAPKLLPADCLNVSVDHTYLYGYDFPKSIFLLSEF